MRKVLYGFLGFALLFQPLKCIGQESKKANHEYNIYLGNLNIGNASYDEKTVNFGIDWIIKEDLFFELKGNKYYESLKSGRDEEKYFYSENKDSLKMDDYIPYFMGKEDRSRGRKDKELGKGKSYSKDVIFGAEIFDVFGGDSIPSKLEVLVFNDVYSFEGGKRIFRYKKSGIYEVHYDVLVNSQTRDDKFRIVEPVKVYLEKKGEKFHLVGGNIEGELKKLGFWVPLNVRVLEKGHSLY